MKIRMRNAKLFWGLCTVAACLYSGIDRAHAQVAQKFVSGDVLIYCQAGTLAADVQTLANQIGATQVIPNKMADVYILRLPVASATAANTTTAVAALKGNAHLKWVGYNGIMTYHTNSVTPNDPRYGEMHPLPQINMPQAWIL